MLCTLGHERNEICCPLASLLNLRSLLHKQSHSTLIFTYIFNHSLISLSIIQVVEASKTAPGKSAVFVPFPYLAPVADVLKGSSVRSQCSHALNISPWFHFFNISSLFSFLSLSLLLFFFLIFLSFDFNLSLQFPAHVLSLLGNQVVLGAQDCYTKPKGAFTGAVSMGMIKSLGAE